MHRDTRDIYCVACGYNLRDQRSGDCPECGSYFDRGQGFGYLETPISSTKRFFANNGSMLAAVWFLAFGIAAFWLYFRDIENLRHLYVAIGFCTLAVVSVVLHFLKAPTYKG